MANNMSYREIETAKEVIAQYDLNETQAAKALELVNERARRAPFNTYHAYHAAHYICAQIEREG